MENIPIEGALRAVFVRSIFPHARVNGVDAKESSAMPGVVAVYAAGDFDFAPQPPSGNVHEAFSRPLLAKDVVRFVGEPLAIVVAETSPLAEDAAESVFVDYDPLPVVVDPEAAVADGAPVLFPQHGGNLADEFASHWDVDVMAGADLVVRGRFVNQRLAPVPLETNAIAVMPEADRLTAWVSTQIPFDVRDDVADALGLDRAKVRVIAPDVGGGFGAKLTVYPEYVLLAEVARRLGRPVRWVEGRSENLTNMTHGRAQIQDVELGARRDGTIVGLRVDLLADMGAYPRNAYLPPTTQQMLSGVYRIPRIACRVRSVVTNTGIVAPYRGAGRPEASTLVERAVDLLADELGMDPVEVRRRNLIPPDAFPYRSAAGATYDVGEYGRALDEALDLSRYEGLRLEQAERRARNDPIQLGIGVSTYVEITAFAGSEFGSVEVHEDGTVTVLTGVSPHGQGHETSLAQIASGRLGVPLEVVRVIHSDTELVPRGNGTYASRSLQLGGSAVFEASGTVVDKARMLAAHLLEVAPADVEHHDDGGFGVAGAADISLSWAELAAAAADPARRPEGFEPGLAAQTRFRERESTFPFGAHVAAVDVDTETGDVRLSRYVAVDDCGRIINPVLDDGQVHGGLAQGIAQALYEEMLYDADGNPLTSTLATYPIPSAADLPSFETAHTETPTPLNPLGAKGIGESATIGSTPAVLNAVVDALSHLGIRHIDMPLSSERVWRAIRSGFT